MSPRALPAAALLLFLGCAYRTPGFVRHYPSFFAKEYAYDAASQKTYFLEGEYPKKTYLGEMDATGRVQYRRYRGFVLQSKLVDGRAGRAFIQAKQVDDESEAPRLLIVRLSDGELQSTVSLPQSAGILAWRRPSWTEDLVLLLSDSSGQLTLKTITPSTGAESAPKILKIRRPRGLQLLDDEPIAAFEMPADNRSELAFYDLATDSVRQTYALPAPPAGIRSLGPHAVAVLYQLPGEDRAVVESLDTVAQSRKTLATVDGIAESLATAGGRAYAVVRDVKRRKEGTKRWFQPRNLVVAEETSAPSVHKWSERKGRLVEATNPDLRLYFSIEDGDAPALWAIQADQGVLSRAAAILDYKPWPYAGSLWPAAAAAILLVFALLVLFFEWDELMLALERRRR
ncbi:MAG: hypothetical protein HY078_04350 [Elusimicrobia bacterium]|nr:hypothetical protein [Elusimicrobiota bacterium]